MVAFEKYCEIKNNYCICYFGASKEYIVILKALRPIIERYFSGLNLYIGHLKSDEHLLENEPNLLCDLDIKSNRHNFAHIYELIYDNTNIHPIEKLITEIGLNDFKITQNIKEHTDICTIITKGSYPTKSLTDEQIEKISKHFTSEGYRINLDGDIKNGGIFVGVESIQLFEAARLGFKTFLVPTGIGSNIYKKIFENGEILDL